MVYKEHFIEKEKIMIEAKLISTTNLYIYEGYKGLTGELTFKNGIIYLYKDGRDNIRTSLLTTYSFEKKILTIKTLNSIYIFEIISGNVSELNLAVDKQNKHIQYRKVLDKEKHTIYTCKVVGNNFINGALSFVEMPEPMTRNEAVDYVNNNLVISSSGDMVAIIIEAYIPK